MKTTQLTALAVATLLACALTTAGARHSDAAVTKLEQKCASKLGKGAVKLANTVVKSVAKCRDADISGKSAGACPDLAAAAKISKASGKLAAFAEKSCGSVCSKTGSLPCLNDSQCPADGAAGQRCTGDTLGSAPFDLANIGFPGAYCEGELGGPVESVADLASCVDSLTTDTASDLIVLVYGSVTNATGISTDAGKCVSSIAKGAGKLAHTIFKGVAKCRDSINKGKFLANPRDCTVEDVKLAAKIDKADAKLGALIDKRCTDELILELDLCGAGIGGTATTGDAKSCLSATVRELADSSATPSERLSSSRSLIECAYPPAPLCGDDVVNQGPGARVLVGEECDGADAAACPGQCLPPGDVFQCTCGDVPRAKLMVDFSLPFAETDAGWTGLSHNELLSNFSGYLTRLENCDCSAFTGATCSGTSVDPVCDAIGAQLPVCSWDVGSATRCDDRGDADGADENHDCYLCDQYAANAGVACTLGTDCLAQCYDAGGTPNGPCVEQSDCSSGEVCRGRCDTTQTCLRTLDGAPLPVNTAGTSVCNVQAYHDPVTGTRNIVTGEHELFYELRSTVHLAESNRRPCPVCGGFCVGGKFDLRLCHGRCSVSQDPCRFDSDCAGAETCLPDTPDCPGGTCELSLVCGAKEDENPGVFGSPCEIDYENPLYGSMSKDCLPFSGKNITGSGLVVEFEPSSSAARTLDYTVPCTSPGFELLDCPCPDAGGEQTKPNGCAPACDAPGPDFGVGCVTGDTAGEGTKCAGGANVGLLCDEDADCPGSACSDNPTHCSGDPATQRFACATNADCGLGICGDACPGGRCLPLCVPEPGDPEDGLCAAGPEVFHCEGVTVDLYQALQCPAVSSECSATCSVSAGPCSATSDCPAGETCEGPCVKALSCEAGDDGILGNDDDLIGAGDCIADARDCFLNPIPAEGGTTLNGKGDHENWYTVGFQCFPSTPSSVINGGAGFGGPGRTRKRGTTLVNTPSIP